MSEEKWYKRDDVEYWKKEYLELSKQLEEKEIVLDKIKEELKKHKPDLDYEPWSEYKISGNILFDIVKLLEEIE